MRGVFVTGTDTGVGKTLVSAALVHGIGRLGLRAAGLKPIAAGCELKQGQWLSPDVETLRAASNVELPLELVNPYAFAPPLAPHIAARQAGRVIEIAPVLEAVAQAAAAADFLVVEGVGGFRVPINEFQDTADMTVGLALPVVMVVGLRLGCLNHALLTAEAIARRGLRLAGWVGSMMDPHMAAAEENIEALRMRLDAQNLGIIPYLASPCYREAAAFLRCADLLQEENARGDGR